MTFSRQLRLFATAVVIDDVLQEIEAGSSDCRIELVKLLLRQKT
jgi:hypothetical protein